MLIPDGYSDIPAGKLASVVTCLEMHAMPAKRGERADAPWRLRHVVVPQADWYRDLYSRVGSQWLWFSRLEMPIGQLEAILRDPKVDIYALEVDGRDEGLLELDFRDGNDCELAFFGLTDAVLGQGAGRAERGGAGWGISTRGWRMGMWAIRLSPTNPSPRRFGPGCPLRPRWPAWRWSFG